MQFSLSPLPHAATRRRNIAGDDRTLSPDLLHLSLLPFLLGSSGTEQSPWGCDAVERKVGRSWSEPWTSCPQILACLCWTPACSLSPALQTLGPDLSLVGKFKNPAVQIMHWWIPLLWPYVPVPIIRHLLWPATQVILDLCRCPEFQFA